MNYRHEFHAGNFADVFKHLILSRIIEHLKRKEKAFRVIDTHAGSGFYELPPASQLSANGKPPEWVDGIGRLNEWQPSESQLAVVGPYLEAVRQDQLEDRQTYPGSPLLARRLLRKQDRLSVCELHPEAHSKLRTLFEGDYQVRVLNLDGWLIPGSQIPPKENRGVMMIDPPFERNDDFDRMVEAMRVSAKRWSGGSICLWYPLKHRDQVKRFHTQLVESGTSDLMRLEIEIEKASALPALHGCGMIVRHPPFTLAGEMQSVLPHLVRLLERKPGSGQWRLDMLTPE